jgi:hypothetical protein
LDFLPCAPSKAQRIPRALAILPPDLLSFQHRQRGRRRRPPALSLRTCLSTCYMTTPAAFSRAFWNWRWLVSPVPFLSLVKSWRAIKDGERSMGLALNLGATTAVTLIGKQSRRSEFMHGTGWANSSTRRSAFLSGLKESIFWMPISPCTISVNGMFLQA